MMNPWIKVGDRFLNLDNGAQVAFSAAERIWPSSGGTGYVRPAKAEYLLAGAPRAAFSGAEAEALQTYLTLHSTDILLLNRTHEALGDAALLLDHEIDPAAFGREMAATGVQVITGMTDEELPVTDIESEG